MQIVGTSAEIDRPAEFRCKSDFLTQLPRVLPGKVLCDQSVAATYLGIAECTRGQTVPIRIANRATIRCHDAVVVHGREYAGRGIEPIVVLCRPKKIVIEGGLRRKSKSRGNAIVRIKLSNIAFDTINWIECCFYHPQIA